MGIDQFFGHGRLDVADRAAMIPTGRLPPDVVSATCAAAASSPAFDAPGAAARTSASPIIGDRTVIKVQHREHERLETALRFDRIRDLTGLPSPRLLDYGVIEGDAGSTWWTVLERMPGTHSERPTAGRQRALGEALRLWHRVRLDGGLRLDDPGGLGVLLGPARATAPTAYPRIAARFADACAGMPMTAIHGDVAVGHNTLFEGDDLTGLLDPGAVEHGPPMLDLAWALAVDMPRGAEVEPLVSGYGEDAVDREALRLLLPLMMVRRLIDTPALGIFQTDGRWISDWLRAGHPELATLVEGLFT